MRNNEIYKIDLFDQNSTSAFNIQKNYNGTYVYICRTIYFYTYYTQFFILNLKFYYKIKNLEIKDKILF